MKSLIIKMIGMVLIGLSVSSMNYLGLWYLIPWSISWFIYELHRDY